MYNLYSVVAAGTRTLISLAILDHFQMHFATLLQTRPIYSYSLAIFYYITTCICTPVYALDRPQREVTLEIIFKALNSKIISLKYM